MKKIQLRKPLTKDVAGVHRPKSISLHDAKRNPIMSISTALISSMLMVIAILFSLNSAVAANLLTNPGFEAGQTGWNGVVRGSVATVVTNPAGAHSGNNYISNYNVGGWSSASQGDSQGGFSTGVSLPVSDAKFYKLSAYVKVPGASTTPADITLRYRFEPSGARVDVGQQNIATESWTLLESAWLQPTAGDTFMSYWEVHSIVNGVVFYADDCSLEESVGYAINGVVKDEVGTPVVGATVQLKQGGSVLRTTTSIAGGAYTFHVQPIAGEAYDLNATKINYKSPDTDVSVISAVAGVTAADLIVTNIPLVTLSGHVTDATTSQPIVGATVTVLAPGGSTLTTTTIAGGAYSIQVELNGTFAVKADKFPLSSAWQVIGASTDLTIDFSLGNSLVVGVYAQGLTAGSVNTWTNKGSLGGKFVPLRTGIPVAGQNGIYNAVKFSNSPLILSNDAVGALITAPAEITGSTANYTVSSWLYEPNATLPDQQTYISWAQRGGPDGSNCELGYGINASYGAVGHWGAPDMGFTTPPTGGAWHNIIVSWNSATGVESLYIDGVLSKNSPVKSLSIGAGLPIILGSGYWNGATTIDPDIVFNAFIARLEVYSTAIAATDIPLLATNTPPVLAVGTIAGKVVTTDGSEPSGFVVTVTTGAGVVAGSATTGAGGTYSFAVAAPANYTVKAVKANYLTMPAPQAAAATIGNTTTVGDFTASPSSFSGVLVDAITGAPIYNGIIQVGGRGGQAVVTSTNGTFSLGGKGNGGVELFADALGYHCTNLLFTATGSVYKKIALVPQVEADVITNGGFEAVDSGLPTSWIQGWDPTAPAPITEFWSTNAPFFGTNSAFVTGAAAFEPLSQFIPADPTSVYNCYFKAIGTNLTAAGAVWFPMFAFRDATFGEMKGWISGEAAPYMWWSHNAPTNWMQYLLFQTYSGDAIQPFVRIAPPAGAVWLSATFCFTGAALPSDQGIFVDDVVMDKAPANVPLVATTPDQATLKIETVGGSVKLTWPFGTLLESSNATGPWTTNSATSPYTVSPVGNKFFRVIVQ